MADGATTSLARTERGLTFPQPALPEPGKAVAVAEGVLWMRLPLPMALDHVNVYAIRDGEGWVIVDCGLCTSAIMALWDELFVGALEGLPVTRVLVTHLHPDHLGAAGWICERFDAPLMMSQLEYCAARMMVADDSMGPSASGETFYRRQGWDDEDIARWKRRHGGFSNSMSAIPRQYVRLSERDVLTIGGRDWTVVTGRGHSPEHVCLWRKDDNVLVSGDQILPKISSNIGVWPLEPLEDPLGDWLASLEDLKGRLHPDCLVLPSHGEPFRGVIARLEALIRGHEVGLTRLKRTLRQPARAIDVFGSLFARQIGPELLGMATAEAVAHLNYLERRGQALRRRDTDGVEWWTVVEDVL